MIQYTTDTITMLTDFFSSQDIEHAARVTGFVKRTSKITGKMFLALITFGFWSDPATSFAQLAAKVSELVPEVTVSPEAIYQRLNARAVAFLKELIRHIFEKIHTRGLVCDDGLFHHCSKVYIADSTGFALPEALHESFPGCGGSASKAGAKLQ